MKTYHEKNLVINNREIAYSGPFRVEAIFRTINTTLEERGYTKREKKTEERVQPEGRSTYIELRPWKEKAPEVMLMLKIKLHLQNVKDLFREEKGTKYTMQHGDVLISLDAWMLTDYEHHWRMQPFTYFLRGMINKFLYKFPAERGYMGELTGDADVLTKRIKELFRSYGESRKRLPSEEEVRKIVEKEVSEK